MIVDVDFACKKFSLKIFRRKLSEQEKQQTQKIAQATATIKIKYTTYFVPCPPFGSYTCIRAVCEFQSFCSMNSPLIDD